MSRTNLFTEFSKTSTKEWKQKIQFDLNGADYNDSLVWESLEGIKTKPFYDTNDIKERTETILDKDKKWNIGQSIYAANAIYANKKAIDFFKKGADCIHFIIPNDTIDLALLFKDISSVNNSIHIEFLFLSLDYIKSVTDFIIKSSHSITLNIDIIGNLARTGNWFSNHKQDFETINNIIGLKSNQVFGIDLSLYQNSGANMIQQLAFAMAHANEYLNHLSEHKQLINDKKMFTFKVAIGSNYFFEISKFRALRILWKTLASEYGISTECYIIAIPSKRNKTLYAYNANMIRTSTECMASILGGADTILNLPYDAIYHKDNEFASRIALNQLLLLKEESYFKTASNAVDGTYYIESLTAQLTEKALLLFKNIEKDGGFLQQLKNHAIQKKVKESAQKEQRLFDEKKIILVGANKFEKYDTTMSNEIVLFPFVKKKIRKTIIEPIIEKRLAEKVEQHRLAKEKK